MANLISECCRATNKLGLQFLVDDVEEERRVSIPLHLSEQVTDLLLSFNLFLEELALQEVRQLSIVMSRSNLVQLEQALVNLLLEVKRGFDSVDSRGPIVRLSLGDILEDNAATTPVLVADELHGVLAFLLRVLAEPLGESVQSHIIAIKVGSHGHVDVASMKLHVDLLVDQGLRVGVEVGADLREGHLVVVQVGLAFKKGC